jgi:hypothetical protein
VEPAAPVVAANGHAVLVSTSDGAGDSEVDSDDVDSDVYYVTAPMVGVFYRAPEVGAKPFVNEGDQVVRGQQVASVEAMKLMTRRSRPDATAESSRCCCRTPHQWSSGSSCSHCADKTADSDRTKISDHPTKAP